MSFASNSFADNAYKQTLRETADPRTMERRVFAQITGELEAADALEQGAERISKVCDALARNQSLWGQILFDVAHEDNQLPQAMRAQLISFALFVDRYTGDVLSQRKSMVPLIELNRSIMLGLAGVAGDAAQAEGVGDSLGQTPAQPHIPAASQVRH